MAKNFDPNKMSRAELEEYVKSLPENRPPKLANVVWLAGFGCAVLFAFITKIQSGNYTMSTWFMLAGAIGCFAGAGYLAYKYFTYNPIT